MCGPHGLSPSTLNKLKAIYRDVKASEAAQLKSLEDGNARLRRLQADTTLDNIVLKDLLAKTNDIERATGGSA